MGDRSLKSSQCDSEGLDPRVVYVMLFVGTLALGNALYWVCVRPGVSGISFFFVWLFELFMVGVAFESAELGAALCARRDLIPTLRHLDGYPKVAVLYTSCDDWDVELIRGLCDQDYPCFDVFVLDDSRVPHLDSLIQDLPVTIVRRQGRAGYKAGNLNNWLRHYGNAYTYFVVADADSILPRDFVSSMVSYAEHPANEDIAIFESFVTHWNTSSSFANLLELFKPLSNKIGLLVENPLGQTLSIGHNNLYRTGRLLAAGRFTESYVAEDYATTLKLVSEGLGSCKIVPVESFERAPSNVHEFLARQSRWALQTFQLASVKTSSLPWLLRLRLLRAFYAYSAPLILVPALLIFLLVTVRHVLVLHGIEDVPDCFNRLSSFHVFWITIPLVAFLTRLLFAMSVGIPPARYFLGTVFSSSLFLTTLWPVFLRVLRGLITGTVRFSPTGRRKRAGLREVAVMSGPTWLLTLCSFVVVMLLPLGVSINLIWIIPGLFAPVVTYRYQWERFCLQGGATEDGIQASPEW